jgi:hypothetical protein
MTEPDVVITDYLLAAESTLFAWLMWRTAPVRPSVRTPFIIFFAATAFGSLAGGTVHGFLLSSTSLMAVGLWRLALIALGATAASSWIAGARLSFTERTARLIGVGAVIEAMGYAAVILAVNDSFRIAVVNYVPATLFLMIAFVAAWRRVPAPGPALGVAGLAASLVAAAIQQFHVTPHPIYFNHNALYHVVQAAALALIFSAARFLVGSLREAHL